MVDDRNACDRNEEQTMADYGVPATAHLRVARPTDQLERVVAFYRDGLGMEVVGSFQNHEGFDGVMLSSGASGWHLEFTRKAGHTAGRAPTLDHLLVFYIPDQTAWQNAIKKLELAGFASVPSFNPYWDRVGKTFEDPDGYRIVLQCAHWPE